RALIEKTEDTTFLSPVLTGLFVYYYNQGAHRRTLDVGREFLREAERSDDAALLCIGHRMIAVASNSLAEFPEAEQHGRQAVDHYRPQEHGPLAWRYVHDIGLAAKCHWSIATWHIGLISKALELQDHAHRYAAELNHHNTTGLVLYFGGAFAAFIRRDFEALSIYATKLQDHGTKYNLPQWRAYGTAMECMALAHAGRMEDGIGRAQLGLKLCDELGVRCQRP